MSVLEQLAARPLREVALGLGLHEADRSHLYPCPACHADRRSRSDRRHGPIHHTERGWRCQACGAAGGVVALVSYALLGERLGRGDHRWRELIAQASQRGLVTYDPMAEPVAQSRQGAAEAPRVPDPTPTARVPGVASLWLSCGRVDQDEEVAAWLSSRGLDPRLVADLDLCRALPIAGPLPSWAASRGVPWSQGWRCVVPAWGPDGRAASMRARWVRPSLLKGHPKTSAAMAGPGSATGCVSGNAAARQALRDGSVRELVVVEGEPDWLTWATRCPSVPVVGVWSGAWTELVAQRVQAGARVAVRVHHDLAGEGYALRIAETDGLILRADVTRSREHVSDENDRLRAGDLPADPWEDVGPLELVKLDEPGEAWRYNQGLRRRAALELRADIAGNRATVDCPRCGQRSARFDFSVQGQRFGVGCACGWVGRVEQLVATRRGA